MAVLNYFLMTLSKLNKIFNHKKQNQSRNFYFGFLYFKPNIFSTLIQNPDTSPFCYLDVSLHICDVIFSF